MRHIVYAALVLGIVGLGARANEEDVLAVRKIAITADGLKAFGEVTATVESSNDGKEGRVTAITLVVGGTKYEVPKQQVQNLKSPLLDTVKLLSGPAKDGTPTLTLEFRLWKTDWKSHSELPVASVTLKGGKLLNLTVHEPVRQPPVESPATPKRPAPAEVDAKPTKKGAMKDGLPEFGRFAVYWLTEKDDEISSKRVLLITQIPLRQVPAWLSLKSFMPKGTPPVSLPILDDAALRIETYEKDSILNLDSRPIKAVTQFAELNENKRTVSVDGVLYRYEKCEIAEAVRLLGAPEGKIRISRPLPPLAGMEQTARALKLLLEAQLKDDERMKK